MKRAVIVCLGFVLATASLAQAQATRTWVSGVGDDANPCSRTAPCKTFAGAISKTAAGGYINVIDPGGFGAVTITKSITIDGLGAQSGVLATFGSTGIIVNAGVNDVVILRNLSIEGAGTGGHGIRVLNAGQVHVENCTIQNFATTGIYFIASGSLFVSDTTVKDITDQGIYLVSGRGNLNRVITSGNWMGVLAGQYAIVSVKNSVATGNTYGLGAAFSATSELNIEDSLVANNQTGVLATNGAKARLSNVSVFSNTAAGLSNDGSSFVVSFGNNRFAGNAADGSFTSSIAVK